LVGDKAIVAFFKKGQHLIRRHLSAITGSGECVGHAHPDHQTRSATAGMPQEISPFDEMWLHGVSSSNQLPRFISQKADNSTGEKL